MDEALKPGIEKLLSRDEPGECEVVTDGKDWVLSYWWWKDESWWISPRLWPVLLEPVVRDFLSPDEAHLAEDPIFIDGVMQELDMKAIDEKVVEMIEWAVNEHKTNAGLHPVEGE